MIRKLCNLSLVFSLLAFIGCAGQIEKPTSFSDQVAYAEGTAQGAIKTVGDLTCLKYLPSGACATPGKPLHPARAKGYLDQLSQVRAAARAASAMPAGGGACLGQPSTPTACLALAQTILAEVQQVLITMQKGAN